MGLAAAKNKRKLGHDPNNTKWSRNTESFGQKILRAQGWQPGQYLGAKDAPHAEWHTEASAAHIRVVLKDDTLGLGAKRNNGDECTGLDAFQDLLGRLNGKSDEALEAERKAREDLKLSLYVERKLGLVRFVRGGWLVNDQLKDSPVEEATESGPSLSVTTVPTDSPAPAAGSSKKRKADQDTPADEKVRKKEKKSKKRKAESDPEVDSEDVREKKDKKRSKKHRAESEGSGEAAPVSAKSSRSKKDKTTVAEGSGASTSAVAAEAGESLDEVDGSAEVRKVKKDKKDKKDKKEKKEKKEKQKRDKAALNSGAELGDSISKEKKRRKDDGTSEETVSSAPTPADSSISTPSGSGYSTPVPTGSSRYLARSRFIAQKKMAFTDSAALNQIFMIKS
ncbi:7c2b9421-6556-4777-8540-74f0db12c9b5 [Thermothielavioides terrestris]|uniref:PinX1-related protein 1 n=2 Tax=Thermothielavioides terrestris TaxID=2587410 RepID=G2R581_THETT|nr:uncharacterized protein THITE_2114063 [Thermothielavioides terrestris NRRL 8126]AEO66164.1 hypothetical protein THITE_2114063 [Thermothielavioides terrestris NRRL 8126]SPQ18576.1 7c2b9421-6556-4777-8540-74f0db12c9b5 [Thermothielavioides terrestris]